VLTGSIDDLGRPLVRISVPGFPDPLVGFIDTGFNGAIILDEAQATKLGFDVARRWYARVSLASLREERFQLCRGTFPWFDELIPVTAFVFEENNAERRARIARKREEEILIGTELLSECRLEIDFPGRQVFITKFG
jgi:predicted aspartyl protease